MFPRNEKVCHSSLAEITQTICPVQLIVYAFSDKPSYSLYMFSHLILNYYLIINSKLGLCVLIHICIKGEVGASFVDLLCFCSVLCLLCLCARLFICALWSPAGKGLTSWLSFVVSPVSLSLSHWYPGSGVVLDCIDS